MGENLINNLQNEDFQNLVDQIDVEELKNLKGIDKEVFYTIPILKQDDFYYLESKTLGIDIKAI